VAASIAVGRRVGAAEQQARVVRRDPLAFAVAAVGGAMLAVACVAALLFSVDGAGYGDYIDNLTFWIPKAQSIYYAHGLDADVLGSLLHSEYPPLVPAMNAATFHFVGGVHPSVLPFQMTLLGVAFVGSVLAVADRVAPRWVSWPTLALLVTTPWFWWRLQSPLADEPVAYLVATAAILCVLWLRELRSTLLAAAFVLLSAATLTKLEGSTLALLLAVVVLVAGLAMHGRSALPAAWLLLAPAAIVPWQLWLNHYGLRASAADYDATDLLDPGFLSGRTGRVTRTIEWMLEAPFNEPQTAVLVCAALAGLVVAALRVPALSAAVASWLALACAGLVSVYWIGKFEIEWYLSTSLSRVGAIVIVAAAVLMPLLLGFALERRASDPRPEPDPVDR
jgi:hypothetical protein